MRTLEWNLAGRTDVQLDSWCRFAAETGLLCVVFSGPDRHEPIGWRRLERWIRSRAVTAAVVEGVLGGAALDVALCSDLVYLRSGAALAINEGTPSLGQLWALGRAGRGALARGILEPEPITAEEAVRLGLAVRVLARGEGVPLPTEVSVAARTTARDLTRVTPGARSALELASFRLLFASGDPREGARAFLDRREPEFGDSGD
jgi:enoyl-CoA hydratase/carnithine racemase